MVNDDDVRMYVLILNDSVMRFLQLRIFLSMISILYATTNLHWIWWDFVRFPKCVIYANVFASSNQINEEWMNVTGETDGVRKSIAMVVCESRLIAESECNFWSIGFPLESTNFSLDLDLGVLWFINKTKLTIDSIDCMLKKTRDSMLSLIVCYDTIFSPGEREREREITGDSSKICA